MATFRYRAATAAGTMRAGTLEAASTGEAVLQLRRLGLSPIETAAAKPVRRTKPTRAGGQSRQAVANAIGELSVLLQAGLPLDRALVICVDNIPSTTVRAGFQGLQDRVKEGAPLSEAMDEARGLFPPIASAMAAAGEADGRLGQALARLAESLDRAEALRQTIVSALVYPAMLVAIASGVILMMMLVVVPQFEGLLQGGKGKLPFMTQFIMATSEATRAYGVFALIGLLIAGFGLRQYLQTAKARLTFDRAVLRVPALGAVVTDAQTSAFARTLGSLVEGGVALPVALTIAQRSLSNSHMSAAVGKVAAGLKEGGGLSGPLAASKVFPPMAVSFLRTGEETAQLGLMLGRLADLLDRSVRARMGRMIAILTPSITVIMGGIVATVIASIMSAILGFNDLALSP